MADIKLTDSEIMQALECCKTEGGCHECPLKNTDGACYTNMLLEREALDLINRQKAEIEKLKEASEEAVSCFHRMESLYNIKCMELKVAKAEAIKELMFNLDNEISTYSSAGHNLNVYAWLKNYIKEMVGKGVTAMPNDNNHCKFCCYLDFEDSNGEMKSYPKENYNFYAGYSKQIDVDNFDEFETENINYCPICGKKLNERE